MDQKTFDIIEKIAIEHSRNLQRKPIGYLNRDDLKNEIWAICLDKLKDFNSDRGELEHFLRVSVKNRLVNRFKDITKSVRSPCSRCPFFDPGKSPSDCAKFGDDRHLCSKWRNYQLSIESRNSLLNASEHQVERQANDIASDKMAIAEFKDIVADKVGKNYRRDLEQLLSGGSVPKQKLKKLKKEILRVLEQEKKEF